jgi:hypothetical protein
MAKKKSSPKPVKQHSILTLKGTEEFSDWLKGLAAHIGLPVTNTIDQALKVLSEQKQYKKPMPRRQKR